MNRNSYSIGKISPDEANNPKSVILAGIELPHDVQISINGKKVITESQIIDGVMVFERIARKPYEITFDFTIREISNVPLTNGRLGIGYVFGQETLKNIYKRIFEINGIVDIKNTLINALRIKEVVIFDIKNETQRGSINIPVHIMCKENYEPTENDGQTILLA